MTFCSNNDMSWSNNPSLQRYGFISMQPLLFLMYLMTSELDCPSVDVTRYRCTPYLVSEISMITRRNVTFLVHNMARVAGDLEEDLIDNKNGSIVDRRMLSSPVITIAPSKSPVFH